MELGVNSDRGLQGGPNRALTFYLSTILDDYSRHIIAWKLCTTMNAADVADTLDLALEALGCDQAKVVHKPRSFSDSG